MRHKYLKDVVTLKMNAEKCTGCGMCINVCPHKVFSLNNGRAQIINKDQCMECGACSKNCPFSVIEVESGTGCAYAVIMGKITGTEPNCGCSEEGDSCC